MTAAQPRHPLGFLSTAPATRRESRLALIMVLVSFAGVLAAMPFARVPLARIPAFIPAYEAALELTDIITAVLLFGQLARLRSRALLALACGYLFDAAMIVPHALSFPGVFTESGLLAAGPQTTAWLYFFWHGGFPLFVIAYAMTRARGGTADVLHGALGRAIALSAAGVVTLALFLTLLATVGQDLLPTVMQGDTYSLRTTRIVDAVVWLLSLAALLALWRLRPASVLDRWLMVVMCAWLFDVALSAVFSAARYDLGWYAGRAYGLLAASFVLVILLLESNRLYGRLAHALEMAEAYNIELEQSREKFARAQRMEAIGQLAGGVAHDFNNLLTVIIGNLGIAIEEHSDDVALRSRLAAAMRGAQRGARVTSQLLATSRRQILTPEPIDLEAAIAAMSDLLRSALTSSISLELALPPRLPSVIADEAQLEVAILNLITNSRDALGKSGAVTVRARDVALTSVEAEPLEIEPGRYVVIAVSDTGAGMSPEVAARAFEPFFTTKEFATNSGLGLSQVHGFARQSGGTCIIDSTPGKGTVVSIYLPAARGSHVVGAVGPRRLARSAETGYGARILVVEDDEDVRAYLVAFLRRVGFDVVHAADGTQALLKLRAVGKIDVLCTDIVMPGGLTGYDVASEARLIRPELKVIFMSGYADRAIAAANTNIPFLAKPLHGDDLVKTVHAVIGR